MPTRRHLRKLAALLVAAWPAVAQGDPGSLVRFADGTALVVPAGFHRMEDALFAGSRAMVPALAGDPRRELQAVYSEGGEAAHPASLSIGRVWAPLEPVRGLRGAAAAVAEHLRGELDLEATVEPAELIEGPRVQRIEVRARLRLEEQRVVRFAFIPGAGHRVLAASYPVAREVELGPVFTRVFDSVEVPAAGDSSAGATAPRVAASAGVGALVVGALWRWRRSRSRRRRRDVED